MLFAVLGTRSTIKFVSNLTKFLQFPVLKKVHNVRNYESAIGLRTLYPDSSLRLSTPSKLPVNEDGKFSGYIPLGKLIITYSRSSGAGGQAVNMINTKVDLRFQLDSADWISEQTRKKLKEKEKMKITKEGFLVIRSEKTRSQQLNLADALEKLRSLIRLAEEEPPKPSIEAEEVIRKRKEKANRMRLIEKRSRSITKANRAAQTGVDL